MLTSLQEGGGSNPSAGTIQQTTLKFITRQNIVKDANLTKPKTGNKNGLMVYV